MACEEVKGVLAGGRSVAARTEMTLKLALVSTVVFVTPRCERHRTKTEKEVGTCVRHIAMDDMEWLD